MKVLNVLVILLLANTSYGFEKESSFLALRQAVSESNKEYNENMKEKYQQEHEQMSEWNERDVSSVKVESGILVESKDSDLQKEKTTQTVNKDEKPAVLHEISMND